jgi:hypothetical protein
VFYKTEEEIAGTLVTLALEEPELFGRWQGKIPQETGVAVVATM